MGATQFTTDAKTIPPVTGRTLLVALGYGVGIGAALGILTGTAALFALYHPLIYLWPMVFILGLAAGWIREYSKSLTPFLIIHMLNSIAMIAAAYFITGWRV